MHGSAYKTGIVIPCYNEYDRLDSQKIADFLTNKSDVLLLFVDDGSNDNTKSLLQNMQNHHESIECYFLSENKGKAEAVRLGLNHLLDKQIPFIGYFDADFSTPLHYIDVFTKELESKDNNYLIVMGSRIRRLGSEINRKPIRHVLGRIFATLASFSLQMPVYDTQCGAKLFHRSVAEKAFQKSFLSRWLFDVEIIARSIVEFGYFKTKKSILEYPLEVWKDEGNSRIKLKDTLIMPAALIKLHVAYHQRIKKIKQSENSHG
jgi:glycosyltransferase involved in cell wall biosynthesis